MYASYRLWPVEYPWPQRLEWNALTGHLDAFQTWLIDERNGPAGGPVHIGRRVSQPLPGYSRLFPAIVG